MKDDLADYGMSRVWESDKCSSFLRRMWEWGIIRERIGL